jgi:hypothetical protein
MIAGGIVAFILGVDAERKSLEEVAEPLSMVGASESGSPDAGRRRDRAGAEATTPRE